MKLASLLGGRPQTPLTWLGLLAGWPIAYFRFGPKGHGVLAALLWSFLILVASVDLRTYTIPDGLLLAGGLATVPLALGVQFTLWHEGLLGLLLCGGLLLAAALASRGGIGGGDVKLVALLGLILGWRRGFIALLAAFLSGGLAGLALLLLKQKRRGDFIAFGPFLALGALAALIWGDQIFAFLFTSPSN